LDVLCAFAFILVCIGVCVLRVRDPQAERQFRVPAVQLVSILGVVACGLMIYGLGWFCRPGRPIARRDAQV